MSGNIIIAFLALLAVCGAGGIGAAIMNAVAKRKSRNGP